MATKTSLSLLTLALAAAPIFAAQPVDRENPRVAQMTARLEASKASLGLNADHAFVLRSAQVDDLGMTHASFQQTYKGVKVFGGDIITHTGKLGEFREHTNSLKKGITLNVTPSILADEALATAHRDLAPKGAYAGKPTSELVIFPVMAQVKVGAGTDATAYEYQPVRYALAYHVSTTLMNGTGETSQMQYMVDAHTGAILTKWNALETGAAVGTGKSQYSGTVTLNTNSTSTGYELRDMTRGTGGQFGNNVVTNLNHNADQSGSTTGSIFTDADNTWGDGANYVEGSDTTAANGQTAGVDAAFGIQATWDMYKNVLGRNGIDGTGKATFLRVHYSNSYDNAFWQDGCFCMTFGDGNQFLTLTSVDVAGHEMSHGVCANNGHGGLNYTGESGGLNESNSDVMGTMVEFYDLGGGQANASTTVPDTGGNWTIGEQLETSSYNHPLRYMYKPSKDGQSPDAWSSSIGNLNVHYSSGPGNREFYFLSQGSSSSSSSDYYSSNLPGGMTGIGNDKAARIHYRALTTYYTSTETYAQARTAHLNAATDLYGNGSAEYNAVANSFAAINVGSPAAGVAVTISPTTASVTTGGTQQFTASVTGNSNTAVTWSVVESGGGTVSTSGLYTAPSTAGTYHVKVTSQADTTKSAQSTVTVSAPGSVSISISPATVSLATGGTQQFSDTVTGSSNTAVTWSVVESGGGTVSTSGLYTAPATAGTYHVKVTSQADTTKSAQSTVTVSASTGTTTQILVNPGFESGATGWTGSTGSIGNWSAYNEPSHGGVNAVYLQGYGYAASDSIGQTVTIDAAATAATLSFWLHIDTAESGTTVYDTLKVQVRNSAGTVLGTLATYSNANAASGYVQKSFNLLPYKGQTVQIYLVGQEDAYLQTSFLVDDFALKVTK